MAIRTNKLRAALIGFVPLILITVTLGIYIYSQTAIPENTFVAYSNYATQEPLELRVSLNTTTIGVGESLKISIILFNELPTTSNVSARSSDFKVLGFPIALWGTCYLFPPIEFMIMKGEYSLNELETLSAETAPINLGCPTGGMINSILFQPRSDVVDLYGDLCTISCFPQVINSVVQKTNFTVSGYWGYPMNTSETQDIYTPVGCCGISFQYPDVAPINQAPFTAGQYTLVVCDEWGQSLILYFKVNA